MRRKNRLRSGSGKQVNNKNWYIVLIKRNQIEQIVIRAFIKFKFPNEQSAALFLKDTKELKHLFVIKMSGKNIKRYGISINKHTGKLAGIKVSKIFKYKYPPERLSFQDKKSYRTTLRRQMRDYGKRINGKFY